jgi:hypothetical protein
MKAEIMKVVIMIQQNKRNKIKLPPCKNPFAVQLTNIIIIIIIIIIIMALKFSSIDCDMHKV